MSRECNLNIILIDFRKHSIGIEWKVSQEEVQNSDQIHIRLIKDSTEELIDLATIFLK